MPINKLIVWTPRILSILLILLMFMFSFDVFESDDVWYRIALGFLIHNIPVFVLTISLIISWKHPLIGAIVFIAAGLFFSIYMLIQNGFEMNETVLIFGLPAIIIGILFGLTKKMIYLKK